MYTTMELRNNPSLNKQPVNRTEYYNVMVNAGANKNKGKKVDVFLTLLGMLMREKLLKTSAEFTTEIFLVFLNIQVEGFDI